MGFKRKNWRTVKKTLQIGMASTQGGLGEDQHHFNSVMNVNTSGRMQFSYSYKIMTT